MTLFAAIDIGSNSTRLLIAEKKQEDLILRHTMLRTTRLAEKMNASKVISTQAAVRTLEALLCMKACIDKFGIEKVFVGATSAVREATNGAKFVRFVHEKTGLQIRVLSAQEEANLGYQGVRKGLQIARPLVVIDIGGGSTEIIYEQNLKAFSFSAALGAVTCTESPLTPTEVFRKLKPGLDKAKGTGDYHVAAVGGTATTLAAISKGLAVYKPELIHGSKVLVAELAKIMLDLSSMDIPQRKEVVGLQADRADIIVSGMLILWVILTYLDVDDVIISEWDILQGMVLALKE